MAVVSKTAHRPLTLSRPMEKYNAINGTAATIGHWYVHCLPMHFPPSHGRFAPKRGSGIVLRAAGAHTCNSARNSAREPSPMNQSHHLIRCTQRGQAFFRWLETPGQEDALYRLGMAMHSMNKGSADATLRDSRLLQWYIVAC